MHIQYHKHHSACLNREMEFKEYGHGGKPVVVFPSSGGRFYEYEDFGMIEACRPYIDAGMIRVFTPDSVDAQSWLNPGAAPWDKNWVHQQYDAYLIRELIPAIKHSTGWFGPMMTTGCSMGAYHALNFYLNHPDVFDATIALSGVYDARFFTGGYMNGDIYLNSPVDYLSGMGDPWFLDRYRNGDIILCTGLGRWEEDTIRDTRALEHTFREKQIPAWVDYWGRDVDHDWPWWRIQMPYFLNSLASQGRI